MQTAVDYHGTAVYRHRKIGTLCWVDRFQLGALLSASPLLYLQQVDDYLAILGYRVGIGTYISLFGFSAKKLYMTDLLSLSWGHRDQHTDCCIIYRQEVEACIYYCNQCAFSSVCHLSVYSSHSNSSAYNDFIVLCHCCYYRRDQG